MKNLFLQIFIQLVVIVRYAEYIIARSLKETKDTNRNLEMKAQEVHELWKRKLRSLLGLQQDSTSA